MYQTTVKGEGLFQAISQGYGDPIRTFGVTDKGETPVSLVNIGLAACITMCVQGYFASHKGNKTMPVQVESRLDNQRFEVLIGIGESVTAQKQKEILAYVEQKCKVKALLSDDISFAIHFGVLEEV